MSSMAFVVIWGWVAVCWFVEGRAAWFWEVLRFKWGAPGGYCLPWVPEATKMLKSVCVVKIYFEVYLVSMK